MSWLYGRLIRPILFTQDAEAAHHRTIRALALASRSAAARAALSALFSSATLPVKLFGLEFPNPVGLAAGMDKYAEALPAWHSLGFGFTEIGGVTWHPQPGNDKPRLFRIPPDEAIINRMGFNNPGAQALAETLECWRKNQLWPKHPVGINLGKSKVTPLEEAPADYAKSYQVLAPHADFFVINVSSPNTPNLRKLQDRAALEEIVAAIQATSSNSETIKPLLIKVAPDLDFGALDEILELALSRNISGFVATNTTISRPPETPNRPSSYGEGGGLSGRPLRARSTEVIRHLYQQSRGKLPIIGTGGIFDADDAWEKITAGASLVQIYTGLVYRGPSIVKSIVKGLFHKVKTTANQSLEQCVGTSLA
jgi:dihydroorotate dehydrogenase